MTILDRYFELSDIAGNDNNSFCELLSLFSEKAKVLAADGTTLQGTDEISKFFKTFFNRNKILKHVWNTKQIDENNIEVDWAVAGQRNDNSLFTFTGKDKAIIGEENKIVNLEIHFN